MKIPFAPPAVRVLAVALIALLVAACGSAPAATTAATARTPHATRSGASSASAGSQGSGAPASDGASTPPDASASGGTIAAVATSGGGTAPATGAGQASGTAGTSGATPASSGATAAASPAGPIAVPSDLVPPLSDAAKDAPIVYTDGCHLSFPVVVPPPCTFGDPAGSRTVVLFGDSIAAQWFPALDALARQRHWRLLSLTKSACPAADVTVWRSSTNGPYTACDQWRQVALARIAAAKPLAVIVSSDRLYPIVVNGVSMPLAARPDVWNAGLKRTLATLVADGTHVVLLGVTPRARVAPPACLAAHLDNVAACATRLASAIDTGRIAADHAVAAAAGATFVDPTPWVCPGDPCLPIQGHFLVYREQDHLTAAFVESLEPRLAGILPS